MLGGRAAAALAAAGAPADAVALANQGETVLAWDRRTGEPLTPAIVWQDRRSAAVCARLAGHGGPAGRAHRAAARPVLRRAEDDLAAGEPHRRRRGHDHRQLAAGPARRPATSPTPPPRPGRCCSTWTRRTGRRRRAGCSASTPAALPAVVDCAGVAGETAAFGGRCRSPGSPSTSRPRCSPSAASRPARPSARTAPARSCWPRPGQRAVRSAAACRRRWPGGWPGDRRTASTGRYTRRAPRSAGWARSACSGTRPSWTRPGGTVPDGGGAVFVPALAGLGAPHWRPDARGAFLGLGLGTTPGAPGPRRHRRARRLGRAAGQARRGRHRRAAAHAARGRRADPVRLLMQAQADLLQMPVEVCRRAGRDRAGRRGAGAARARRRGQPGRGGRPGRHGTRRGAADRARTRRPSGWPSSRPPSAR